MQGAKYENSIPGYTGYIPTRQEQQISMESNLTNGCIPGKKSHNLPKFTKIY